MRYLLLCCAAATLLIAGCKDANTEAELAATKARLASTEKDAMDARADSATAQGELAALRSQVSDLKSRLETAQKPAQPAPVAPAAPDPQVAELKGKIASLEQKIADLEAEKAKQPAVEVKPEPEKPAQPDPAALAENIKRIDSLLPLVKSDASTGKQRDELLELLFKSDKATRERVVADIEAWVKAEPENKHARMALANVLVSRFADLKRDDFMGQATLAGKITTEAEKSLELDPEFYEAVAFLALMKVEYPVFTPEFKAAYKDFDRAIELQAKLTWEDRFADIYVGYSQWYRKQGKLDEAATKCQAGLDKAPRNDALIAEKAKIEEARKPATGE